MIVLTVHEPPEPATDRVERAAALEFIRDSFNWTAAIFAPIWMLANKLWIAALVYVVAVAAIVGLFAVADWDERLLGLILAALHLWIGFEAASLQRWTLELSGWRMLGTVTGRNRDECERRFLDGWLAGRPIPREREVMDMINTMRGDSAAADASADTGSPPRRWFTLPWGR